MQRVIFYLVVVVFCIGSKVLGVVHDIVLLSHAILMLGEVRLGSFLGM